jgi:hypothetical protein
MKKKTKNDLLDAIATNYALTIVARMIKNLEKDGLIEKDTIKNYIKEHKKKKPKKIAFIGKIPPRRKYFSAWSKKYIKKPVVVKFRRSDGTYIKLNATRVERRKHVKTN